MTGITNKPLPRYPDYDVLRKHDSPSWDDATRAVLDERLAIDDRPAFCDPAQWRTLHALCECIVPQPAGEPHAPVAALVDRKIASGHGDGYRHESLPRLDEAWRIGLAALDDESRSRHGTPFTDLDDALRGALLHAMQQGALTSAAWQRMPCALFFTQRVLHDICAAYYSHPYAWNAMGFGGPANPRGYVRMGFDRRDPWEAAQGDERSNEHSDAAARRENRRAR